VTSADKLGMIVAVSVVIVFVGIGVGMSNVTPEPSQISRPGAAQEGFDPRMTPNVPVREIPSPVTREIENSNERNILQNEKESDCIPQRTLFQKLVNQNPEFLNKYGNIISSEKLESSHIIEMDSKPITISYDEHVSKEKPFRFTETLRSNVDELKETGQFNNQYFIEDKFIHSENGVIIYKRTLVEISNEFQYKEIFERNIPTIDISKIQTSDIIKENIEKQSELCPNNSTDISSVTGIYEDIEYAIIENEDSCYDMLGEGEKIIYPIFGCIIPHSGLYQDAKDYANGIIVENMPSIENCKKDDNTGTYTCNVDFINGFTESFSYHEGITERYVQEVLFIDVEVYYLDFSVHMDDTFGIRAPISNEIVVTGIPGILSDNSGTMEITSVLEGKNLSKKQYAELGINSSQLHDGQEFIFIFDNNASAHARILGINVIGPHSIELGNIHEGENFESPLTTNVEFNMNIPKLIAYEYGVLSIGVDVKADVTAKTDKITAVITDSTTKSPELEFSTTNFWEQTVYLEKDGPPFDFEFNFSEFTYYPEIILEPQARISLTANLEVVDFTYKTDYYPIFSMTITPELKTHDGSNGTFEFNYEEEQ